MKLARGYPCDSSGTFKVKVYKAEAKMSDESTRVIYATISMENFEKGKDVDWDNFGIRVVDPKTVL